MGTDLEPHSLHQHRLQLALQFAFTLRFLHLFLRTFLAHFFVDHLPGVSWQMPAMAFGLACGIVHTFMPPSQPDGWYMGLHVVPRRPSGFVHMKSYAFDLMDAPSSMKSQISAQVGGGDGGGAGGAYTMAVPATGALTESIEMPSAVDTVAGSGNTVDSVVIIVVWAAPPPGV